MPTHCSLCGATTNVVTVTNDTPCPSCGHPLHAADQLLYMITQRFANVLTNPPNVIDAHSTFAEIEATSLEVVELILDLEEEFGIDIPVPEADRIKNVGDIVRSILKHRT